MIRSSVLSVAFVLTILISAQQMASAQVASERIQRPINTPTFSPYLNMFRRGDNSGAALNYYGLVRPQLQAYESSQQLGQSIQQLRGQQQRFQQAGAPRYPSYSRLGITGHPAVFQSFSAGAAGSGSVGGGVGLGGLSSAGQGASSFSAGFSAGSPGSSTSFGSGGLPGTGFQRNGFGAGGLTGHSVSFGAPGGRQSAGFGAR